LAAPMVPAIKDIQNLKSAHLIGKPEFGAVIESNVSKNKNCLFKFFLGKYLKMDKQELSTFLA
jgi:hypothetical protein